MTQRSRVVDISVEIGKILPLGVYHGTDDIESEDESSQTPDFSSHISDGDGL